MDGWRRRRLQRLYRLRFTALTEPLAEKTRPAALAGIVGQAERLRALTAAVRPVLEAAKANPRSPFREDARFVEVDAPAARFDERDIAARIRPVHTRKRP